MKRILNIFTIWLVTFTLFYLAGAFYSASFDISKWTEDTRLVIAYFWCFISLIGTFGYFLTEN